MKHVVIVGGGFGGLRVARRLRRTDVRVTIVDRNNYHLFQPLLYQVATGGLSPANIATPLRTIVRRQRNCETLLAEVVGFQPQRQEVVLADGLLKYDYLVVAAGATHFYFGNDQWSQYAPGLKTIAEATEIRRRIYVAFEAAEREQNEELKRQWMTFVIVGGGPTGVELAGAISEIARQTLRDDFRYIRPSDARILIVEGEPYVLSNLAPELSEKAAKKIRGLGIEVHTHTRVTDVEEGRLTMRDAEGKTTELACKTVLWAAGVKANPLAGVLAEACQVSLGRGGRVPVDAHLNVGTYKNIFAIGDLAELVKEAGGPLPGVAPVAMQQGEFVAETIQQELKGHEQQGTFQYHDRGSMATIGRAAAVAQIGRWKFCGVFAWLLWLVVHLMQIVQFQNRLLILLQWCWNYLTFNRSARIITGEGRVKLVADETVESDDAACQSEAGVESPS